MIAEASTDAYIENRVFDSVPEHKERSPQHTWGTV